MYHLSGEWVSNNSVGSLMIMETSGGKRNEGSKTVEIALVF